MENKSQYVLCPLSDVISVKSVCTIHYFKYTKQYSFHGEQHDFWELVYIDSGKAIAHAGDQKIALEQGQVIFHRPNEYHNIQTDDRFANSVIISFDCKSRAMSFFENRVVRLNDYEKSLLGKIVLEGAANYEEKLNDPYLTKMTKKQIAPFGGEQLIKNYLELLLISIIRENAGNTKNTKMGNYSRSKHADEIVAKIITMLQKNLYSSINLSEIAQELFFSKTYIKNLFKKETGTTIIQYYINLKIEEAKKLISQNKFTFTEIAYRLNFNSVHYFSRLFKLHTSQTPSEYAKSIKIDHVL